MSSLETVKAFYAALAAGDVPAVMALFSDRLTWTEAQGFPYFGGTWTTPNEVLEKLFVPLATEWDGFSVQPHSFVTEGDQVVSFGQYAGTYKATGLSMVAPFAHLWRAVDGKVESFTQHTDTVLVRAATTP